MTDAADCSNDDDERLNAIADAVRSHLMPTTISDTLERIDDLVERCRLLASEHNDDVNDEICDSLDWIETQVDDVRNAIADADADEDSE